jgi:CDP-glucose 4,6-dehydratase
VEAGVGDGFWRGRRVLVTGCSGFLGSWLTRALVAEGADVAGLVRSGFVERITAVPGDVTDLPLLVRTLRDHEIDTVFHLAAQAIVGTAQLEPIETFETNVRGTWNLLEACRGSDRVARVVVASGDKAYGSHERLPYEEDFALQGRQPYAASKSCGDLIATCYHHSFGLPVTITRCANLFGAGDLNWNRIVPGTIRSVIEGTCPVIRSDGTPLRDYIHVDDAVRAYLTLARAMEDQTIHGEAFNFGTGEPVSVIEMTRRVLTLAGREDLEPDVQGRATGEISRQYMSSAKALRLLGWRPERTLDEGLRETIAWYREFLSGS